jgi:hypothetical protein
MTRPIWNKTIIASTIAACGLMAPATHANDQYEIEVSGVVEVEASGGRATDGSANSDITLATVEIGIDTAITDHVSTHILLLHEEDDTNLEIDEGTITLSQLGGLPIEMTAGQMYIPFGNFESHMVSDPLTLEIGETRESVVQFSSEAGNAYGSIYSFKGTTRNADESDRVKGFGANIGFSVEHKHFNLDTGISYISNMAETDTIEGAVTDPANLTDSPAGIGLHAIVRKGPLTVIAEYIGANDGFATADIAFNANKAEPAAYNVEAGYELTIFGKEATMAVAAQGTSEAQALDLPESRLLGGVSINLREQTSLSFEWASSDDYDAADGGSGLSTDMYTAQIAVEF